MKKDLKIMELEIPTPEAADLTTRAAAEGVPTSIYLGILALSGAYGATHPEVAAFRKRAKSGQSGPKTQDAEEGAE